MPEVVNQPLINGEAYTFAQLQLLVGGVPVFEVLSLDYSEEQTKENNFGAGVRPTSRGRAEINASGSIELSQNDVEKLRLKSPDGSLNRLQPFTVIAKFDNGQQLVVDKLKNCEFTNDGVETAQGDTQNSRSFDLIMSHIEWGF